MIFFLQKVCVPAPLKRLITKYEYKKYAAYFVDVHTFYEGLKSGGFRKILSSIISSTVTNTALVPL